MDLWEGKLQAFSGFAYSLIILHPILDASTVD